MSADSRTKLSTTTIALHWIVGLMMICLIAVGIFMEEFKVESLYYWHKSFGVLIVFFVLARIAWRARQGWPPHVGNYSNWERTLSKLVHWLLIIATIMMPISGMMMSGAGGHGIPFFGIELVAPNPNPENPEKMIALSRPLARLGHELHGLGGNLLIAAILLHVAGAIKHEAMDKDGTLRRMFGAEVK